MKQPPSRLSLYRSVGMVAIGLFIVMKVATDIASRGESLRGRAEVLGGDTIAVEGVQVRLLGVAAPELADQGPGVEAGGGSAAAFLRRLVEGQTVVCELTGERIDGREVAVCRRDGQDIGAAVIEAGLARDCPRLGGGRYAGLEQPAARSLPLPGDCEPR